MAVTTYDANKHNFELSEIRNRKNPEDAERERISKTVKTMLIYKDGETRRVNIDGTTELPHPEASVLEFKQPEGRDPLHPPEPRWDWAKDGWSKTPPVAKAPKVETPKA